MVNMYSMGMMYGGMMGQGNVPNYYKQTYGNGIADFSNTPHFREYSSGVTKIELSSRRYETPWQKFVRNFIK